MPDKDFDGGAVSRFGWLAARLGGLLPFLTRSAQWLFRWRWLLGAAWLCTAVFFAVHGHSIGIWDDVVREKTPAYSYQRIGRLRFIRSDEWLVSTPWCIAQTQTVPRFPVYNTQLYYDGMYMGLTTPGCPVWNRTAIGQFHNWGFFLFGAARGLAWSWWVRYLGIFLLGIEFFLLVTGRNRLLAVAGALTVTLASPTQWLNTTIPYHLLYVFGFCVAYWRFLHADNTPRVAFFAAVCTVFFCSFVLALYPPFQLPLLVLLLAVCLCFRLGCPPPARLSPRLLWTLAGACVTGWVLWRFAADNREGIARIANSVYPGRRFYTGGDWSYANWLLWPLFSMYFPFRDAPWSNVCAMSMFLAPMPALVVVVPWLWVRATDGVEKRVFCVLSVLGMVLLGWCLFQFPALVARYSLLFTIPPPRAFVIASFALQLAGIVGVYLMHKTRLSLRRAWAALLSGAAVSWFLFYIGQNEPARTFFFLGGLSATGLLMLSVSAAVFGLLNYGLLRGHIHIFCTVLILYSLVAGLTVHPINRGISPIMDKQLAEVCRRIHRTEPSARWIYVEGHQPLSQYLTALGLPTVTGLHGIADVPLWRILDLESKYENYYNRYAHVFVRLDDNGLSFETPQADLLICALRPEDLGKIPRLRFVLSPRKLPADLFDLVEYLKQDSLYIYRLRDALPDD